MKNPLSSGDKSPKTIEHIPEIQPQNEITLTQPNQATFKEDPEFFADSLLEDREMLLTELEKLAVEEASLKQEKNTLLTFREQLKKKIKDELDLRKKSVEQLKTEVAFMKAECEGLVKVVNSSVNTSTLPK